jgi:hypothetical protein
MVFFIPPLKRFSSMVAANLFSQQLLKITKETSKKFAGDQDYLSSVIKPAQRRFFPAKSALSWRWQALDGGMHPYRRTYAQPGKGTEFDSATSLLIFHGQPKPDQVADTVIKTHWC